MYYYIIFFNFSNNLKLRTNNVQKTKKSVIGKNKLLLTNLSNKRVNKTPSKSMFPNRTNLTFANIIVNMNSTPSFNSIDSWNAILIHILTLN